MSTIGIFGGSFNPPHAGHLHAVTQARAATGMDEVWMLVTPGSPHKSSAQYASLADRLEMCRILGYGCDWLKPTDIEKNFKTTRTADTLTHLKNTHPEHHFVWIMGADGLANFHTWDRVHYEVEGKKVPDWQYILHNFPIVILERPGQETDLLQSLAALHAQRLHINDPGSLRDRPNGWSFIPCPPLDVSSSNIVRSLAAGSRNIKGLPPEIESYILRKGLYDTAIPQPFAKSGM